VEKSIGSFARPERIQIVRDLPKTKSGKIVRRILRKLAAGDSYEREDLTTITDPGIIKEIKQGVSI
jgi:acetyl-CoA synthetase